MEIQNIFIIHFFKIAVFTVNEHENICIAGLKRWAGYATVYNALSEKVLPPP
jgi:hypothetical protein